MADDQQNPYTMMGMAAMMQPNKYSLPQYKNGLSLPGFRGPATDAHGNVIQSYADALTQHDAWDAANPAAPAQGTTLNSVGAGLEPAGSPARAMQNAGYGDWALLDPTLAASRQGAMGGEGSVAATSGWNPANPASRTGVAPGAGGATGTASGAGRTASGAAQTNPVDMRQAYLDALANPGHVTTPGATIPASQPVGSPSVLDSFLAANKGSGDSAGGYSNQGFFDTLNKLKGNSSASSSGGAAPGVMSAPSQGTPGSAFSQAPTFGSGGTMGGAIEGNSLAGMGNWSGQVPSGGWQGGWAANSEAGSPFENASGFASVQKKLRGV